ncbi:MAG TPA: UDP-glucose 4-epimerase GalE, partial [Vicinamibacteria bacterium]|nr:UDP-glucose 4-epimerase GalE [Vicinamibacteria bacterium]
YIGSHGVRELRDAGHEVAVLDDLSAGHRRAVPDGVALHVGDLADRAVLREALSGVESVIHFAGVLDVGESVREPLKYWRINLQKGIALLEGMAEAGVRKIIFSSTCATYGVPVRVPIDESHPQEPINPYGQSKRAFERALRDLANAGVLRAVALRYFNAAGCHPDGSLGEDHDPEIHLIPLAIDAVLGRRPPLTVFGDDYDTPDGTCIRDYIHVQDLAVAHVLALRALEEGEPFRFYNLGTETGHSVREVLAAVGQVAGREVPSAVGRRRPGDPPRLVASAAKIRGELGFRPRHAGLHGVVETALRWRLDHPKGYA